MIGLPDSFLKQYNEKHSPHTLFGIISSSVSQGASWATALLDWAKRKEITINGASKTATFTDSFAGTDDWTDTGTSVAVNTTTDVIDWNVPASVTNDATHYDLTSVSDIAFVLRFKLTISAFTANTSGNPKDLIIGLSSADGATSSSASQDGLGLRILTYSGAEQFILKYSDGGDWMNGSGGTLTGNSLSAGTTHYIEMVRSNTTKFTLTFYADSAYTEVTDTKTVTVPSTLSVRYLKAQIQEDVGTTNGTLTGTIDDIQFWNGVTTVENIPSQQTATFEDDFTSDAWADVGTDVAVGTNVLDFDVGVTNAEHSTSYDIGTANISETTWMLRWKQTHTTITDGLTSDCALFVGLSSNLAEDRTAQNFIGMYLGASGGGTALQIRQSSASGAPYLTGGTAFTNDPATGTVHYYELIRESATQARLNIYSDSAYTTLIESQIDVISTAHSSLRYVRVFNDSQGTGTNANVCIGTIDDMKFYNNITEVNPATLTDYPLTIKIQGDADLMEKTAETVDEGFTVDNYLEQDDTKLAINESEGRFDFNAVGDGSNDSASRTITALSDTAWVMRCKYHLTSFVVGSGMHFTFGFSSETSATAQNGTQNSITIQLDSGDQYVVVDGGVSAIMATAGIGDLTSSVFTFVAGTDYYVELKRTSATTATGSLYADSAYTVLLTSVSGTIGNATGLDNIKFTNRIANASGSNVGYIEDMKIWDGITNPVNQEVATYTGDMSTGWTTSNAGSGFTLDGTNHEIDFLDNYTNDNVAIDLDSLVSGSISTSAWVIRFTYQTNGTASGDNVIWWNGVSDTESVVSNSTSNDFVGFSTQTQAGTTNTVTYLSMGDNDALHSTDVQTRLQLAGANSADLVADNTNYYVQISRSGSSFTVKVYSDSTYSTLIGEKTNATPTGSALRYFVSCNYSQGGSITGTLSDFQFWNGISSPNAEGRKIVFTDNAFAGDAVEYASETVSYDPINGDLEAVVKIPSLATGADTTIQMYYDYTPDANPSYVPEVIPTVSSILEQDFSADESWTHSAKTSISSGALNWQNNATGTNLFLHAYRAIPQLKDDYFDVRFKLDIDVLSGSGGQDQASICWFISDTTADSGYGVGFRISFGNPTYTAIFQAVACVTGTSHNYQTAGTDIAEFAEAPSTGIYYIKIKRTSSTVATVGIYSDSDYTTLVEEETLAITSSYISLDNFMISTRNGSNETTRSVSGTVDDFTIVNNNREQATWNGNYKAVHHLQGNSTDSTVYGNDGTDTAISYEQQNNSVGAGFNGTTSIIGFTTDSSLDDMFDGGGVYSTTFNVKSDGEGSTSRLLDKGALSIKTLNEASGLVRLEFKQAWSGNNGTWQTAVNVSINELHTLDVIYNADSVSNDPVFILDGVKLTVGNGITETLAPTGTRTSDAGVVYNIGNELGITNTVDGFIGEARFSDVTRPSSEAITSYNAEKSDTDMTTVGTENTQ